MKFKVIHNAKIKELGAAIITTSDASSDTEYSYIELEDGSLLRKISINHALESKFTLLFNKGIPMDLHISKSSQINSIIAIRGVDNRLFAVDMSSSKSPAFISNLLIVIGVATLPLLFLGFFPLAIGIGIRQHFYPSYKIYKHISTLPDAILI